MSTITPDMSLYRGFSFEHATWRNLIKFSAADRDYRV